MAYIVTSDCHKCKYTDCVAVCPVDCFYELETMLVIHPDECIDCGACEPECPANAIYDEPELPAKFEFMIELNAVASGAAPNDKGYKNLTPPEVISEMKDPYPNADDNQYDKIDEVKQFFGI